MRRNTGRRGLTLMELVIVLAILVAVAAIMVPLIPNLLRRSHKATDATQTSEVAKSVQLYQAAYVGYPDNFDLLTDGTNYPTFLPGGGTAPFGGFTTLSPLTAAETAALQRSGVNRVQKLASATGPAPFHPTLNPYGDPSGPLGADLVTLNPGSTGTQFAVLSRAGIAAAQSTLLQTELASDPTARYVVFGVGPRCSMVSKTMQDAPTSVPQEKTFTPDNTYCRVGVVFKVSGTEVEKSERARFVAAVALEDDELEATEKDIVGYYGVAASP